MLPAPAPSIATLPSAPRWDADYLENPAPAYPPLSRRAGEEGTVMLKVLVEPSGSVAKVEIQQGSGYERLDKSAISAVLRWRFVPAKQGNEALAAWVLVPIAFSLKVELK
jgi:protein TonB